MGLPCEMESTLEFTLKGTDVTLILLPTLWETLNRTELIPASPARFAVVQHAELTFAYRSAF